MTQTTEPKYPYRPLNANNQPQPMPRTLSGCFASIPVRQLSSKEYLFTEGDPKRFLYQIETGAIMTSHGLATGKRHVLNFAFPGDFVGLEAKAMHTCDAQAISETRLRCLSAVSAQRHVRECPEIASEMHEVLSQNYENLQKHAMTISRLDATGRVATFLLALATRSGHCTTEPTNIHLPMLRIDIADYLSISVETVSRALSDLKRLKAINLIGYHEVELTNLTALVDRTFGPLDSSYI